MREPGESVLAGEQDDAEEEEEEVEEEEELDATLCAVPLLCSPPQGHESAEQEEEDESDIWRRGPRLRGGISEGTKTKTECWNSYLYSFLLIISL